MRVLTDIVEIFYFQEHKISSTIIYGCQCCVKCIKQDINNEVIAFVM